MGAAENDEEGGVLKFSVNGKLQKVSPDISTQTLIQYLRESGLTGTKLSCGEGNCGACTVLITSKKGGEYERYTVNACTTLVCSLHGSEVTTVEGLGSTHTTLHPIQERLYSCHGSQCGFCSPGMVMSMAGVLCKNSTPDIEDIVTGLQGNLCRCTGYRPILEAFSTFSSKPMAKSDQKFDPSEEEVETYDVSKFKDLKPEDLQISENTKQVLDNIEQVKCVRFKSDGSKWFYPSTVAEALCLSKQFPEAVYRQGGTGGYKKFSTTEMKTVISLSSVLKMKEIVIQEEGILIGGGVTYSELVEGLKNLDIVKHRSAEVLKDTAAKIASTQLRNVATLVGGILWDHSASDMLPILTVAKAVLLVESEEGQRKIPVRPHVTKELSQGDIVGAVFIPNNSINDIIIYKKQAKRKTVELGVVNMALFANFENAVPHVSIVIGGVDLAVKQSTEGELIMASNVEKHLISIKDFPKSSTSALLKAIQIDFGKDQNQYKIQIISEMLTDIFKSEKKWNIKSHQLFEKTSATQSMIDPITRPIPHISAAEQCTGEADYTGDVPKLAGELFLFPVHSTQSHANIKSINTENALRVPGVVSWVSAQDVPGANIFAGAGPPDEHIFPEQEVHFSGQIIGVIAAETPDAGKQAVSLVEVVYEAKEALLSITDAVAQNSSFEISKLERIQDGELLKSTNKSFYGQIKLGGQLHIYMETHGAVAIPGKEKSEMIIYSSNQSISGVQKAVALALKVPQHKIVVKAKRIGGGFGGKEGPLITLITAVAASKLRRPCRLTLDRTSDVLSMGHRHETHADYEIGFDETGKITKAKFECNFNAGCSRDLSVPWGAVLLNRLDGGYTLKNFEGKAYPRKTNLTSNTAFRGFGGPEGTAIIEECIERIAQITGKDPAEVRMINLTRENDLLHYGDTKVYDDNLLRCWEDCIKKSDYFEKRKEIEAFNANPGNKNVRRGISIVPMKFAPFMPLKFLNQASAYVRIYTDGSILLSHGGIEMGQGLHTKMIQVASRVLKVPMEKFHLIETSTEININTTSTGGSTGTDLNGHAVVLACEDLAAKLAPLRDANPDMPWEQVIFQAYLQRIPLTAYGFYNRSKVEIDPKTNTGLAFNYLTTGAACTVVEVDCASGNHQVLSTNIVMDVGQSLNPAIDIGQVEGAFVQGYGYMTMEEVIHGLSGEIATNNLSTYKIPTVSDIPQEMNVTLLRNCRAQLEAVFSSKGIGEPPLNLSISVVTALRHAVASYRKSGKLDPWFQMRIPFTTERIFRACHGLISDEEENILTNKPYTHI